MIFYYITGLDLRYLVKVTPEIQAIWDNPSAYPDGITVTAFTKTQAVKMFGAQAVTAAICRSWLSTLGMEDQYYPIDRNTCFL